MSDLWQTTLFIVLGTWSLTLTGAGIKITMNILERLTRIETVFEITGSKSFKSLHRPLNEFKLDTLIEKYKKNNDDLPLEDWIVVYRTASIQAEDNKVPQEVRSTLVLTAAFAAHKILAHGNVKADELIKLIDKSKL